MIGSSTSRTLSHLFIVVVSVLVIAVLYLAKVLFLPLAFSILFAFLLAPAVTLLERIRLPRGMAVLVVMLGFCTVVASIGWIVGTQLIEVANDLPTYRANIAEKLRAIHTPQDSAFSRARGELEQLNQDVGLASASPVPDLKAPEKKPLGASPEHPVHVQEVTRSNGRLDQLGGIVEPLITCLLTLVFTFFVLLEREDLRNRVIGLTSNGHLNRMTQAMSDASSRISRYFQLQFMVNALYGAVISATLAMIGLPHAILFGALTALLRFIPYIGPPIAGLLPTALSLAVFHEWTNSLYIVSIFLFLEVVTGNYIEPRLYGKHTGLSPLAILIAAAFWTLIWGPVGLVLSVPLTVCLVVMGRHVPFLEFLTVMLGDRPAIPPSASFYQRLLARDEREAESILSGYMKDRKLEELYDEVVLPALNLAEQDRSQQDLEDSTIRFIYRTTRDFVEDLGQKESAEPAQLPRPADGSAAKPVYCLPVRDEADELAAMMLAQLLDRDGIEGVAIPLRRTEEILATLSAAMPDVVLLSGFPQFGIGRFRRFYRSLRTRYPQAKILIGIWEYGEDESKAAREISRGEAEHIATKLVQAASVVRSLAHGAPANREQESGAAVPAHSETAA